MHLSSVPSRTSNGCTDLRTTPGLETRDTWFGDSHVHSRAVFGINGRMVHWDFDVCTQAGSPRIVGDFVSQRIMPGGEGMSRAGRSLFAFLVHPSRFLFLHRPPESQTGRHNRILAACWNAEL